MADVDRLIFASRVRVEIIDPRDTRPLLIRYLEAVIPRMAHDLGPKPRYGVRP